MRVPVTLQEGTADQVVRAVRMEVANIHKKRIELSAGNYLIRKKIRMSVSSGYADELIPRVLQTVYARLSWKLLFGYGARFYVLNVTNGDKPPRQIIEHP